MKFILLAEGTTEKIAVAGFLKRWLDSQLAADKCPRLRTMLNDMLRLAKAHR
jgi:hypothetical protein